MLKKISPEKIKFEGGRFAIVASKYNLQYVDGMLKSARAYLKAHNADLIEVVRVPGAYEIPVAAAKLVRAVSPRLNAVICLGVIIRGATTHAQHIGEAVTQALTQLQIMHEIPIIHEVLLLENEEQAKVRCLSRDHNRGTEAAATALEMASVLKSIDEKYL